ncbi:glutathione S-transferase family protein [Amphritea atlantica]|uniref:Glutathione S-transferase family protein n=1 Tax=Amphritea atlantica TaxID=355243 RepID=A0ABY5GY45_9GAMM|nr:glutathione S-transferase family protein [Amphritea atlantica]
MKQHSFHLISHALCPYVQRAIITLKEKRIRYTRSDIDLAKKPAWCEQTSPLGKVPILVVDDNRTLFESAVICEYLDEVTSGSLHSTDSFEKAYHRSWIEMSAGILNNIASLYNAKDRTAFQTSHTDIKRKFQLIEKAICGVPFFSGEKFHLIDATYGPVFRYFDVFDSFTDLNTFVDLPKCQIWRNALRQRKSIQQAVSEDYPDLLIQFLIRRNSYISQLIPIEGSQ